MLTPLARRPPAGRLISIALTTVVIAVTALTVGCSRDQPTSRSTEAGTGNETVQSPLQTLRIAEQFGLAYTPLAVIRERNLLEEYLPETKVEWVQLGNATAIREAMLSGRLDVGFMGIPPFLIGADRGMEWRAFTGLSRAPLHLVTTDPDIRTLQDITSGHRIALPQPGSIQHILLSMAAAREFGEADRFDTLIITLAHPDAMTALLAGTEITAHFASPPYVFEELAQEDARSVLSGTDAFGGPFTFIVGVTAPGFGLDGPEADAIDGVRRALAEAMALLEAPAPELVADLAAVYGVDTDILAGYLANPELAYTPEIAGLGRFRESMIGFGYLAADTPAESALLLDPRELP